MRHALEGYLNFIQGHLLIHRDQVQSLMDHFTNSPAYSTQDKWKRLKVIGCCLEENSIMVLLLPLFTNIRSIDLTLSQSFNKMDDLVSAMLAKHRPFQTVPGFTKLAEVKISPSNDKAQFSMHQVGSWLQLDSICRVDLSRIITRGMLLDFQIPLLHGVSPNVKHIELRGCNLDDREVSLANLGAIKSGDH